MDIIEALKQDIRRARESYRLERTARAYGRLASARGDLAVAWALIDCGFRAGDDGRFERAGELCGAANVVTA
jgi:hypothetical protein